MADVRWIGGTTAVAQVDFLTPGGTIEAGDLFVVTLTGENGTTASISGAASGTTVKTVCDVLGPLLVASTNTLFAAVTWTEDDAKIIGTAKVAGVPFHCTVSTTEAGGGAADDQTFTRSASVANAGPYDYSTAANWDTGIVPGASASQNVYIEDATIYYGLDHSAAAETLSSLNITHSVVGANGATGMAASYLQTKATIVEIGYNYGPGTISQSAPINLSLGATASTVTIHNTGTNATSTLAAVRIKANEATTVITVKKGKVGIANEPGETTTVATINVSYVNQVDSDADVFIGSGVTLTTLMMTGGECLLRCAGTTVSVFAGNLTTIGSGAITTLNLDGGNCESNSSGTITAANVYSGTLDLTKSRTVRTITTLKVDPGGKVKYDPGVITLTNKIQPIQTTNNIVFTATES